MRPLLLPLAMALSACTGPAVQPSGVRAASVRIDSALERVIELHAQGRRNAAADAWREAHYTWHATVAPGLRPHLDPLDVVALELHLGRIRAAIEDRKAQPDEAIARYREAVASPLAALPGSPP